MQRLVGQELEMTPVLWVAEEGERMAFHAPFPPASWHPMPQPASREMIPHGNFWQDQRMRK